MHLEEKLRASSVLLLKVIKKNEKYQLLKQHGLE
jgi:hypothetical protein